MTVLLPDTGRTGPGAGGGPGDPSGRLPLTSAQSGVWFAQSLDPLSPAQNTSECLEIDGPLDTELFAAALRRVTSGAEGGACDSLRKVFCSGGALPRETADRFGRMLPGVGLHHL